MDLNLSCAKDFRHLNYMLTWSINWRRLVALINFQRHSLKWFPINILSITLMYCNRLHAWWSTHSLLATLLSSLIARWWEGLQTLWRSDLKTYLLMAWWGPDALAVVRSTGVYLLDYFAPVFSLIYCWVFIFASSPCFFFLICMFMGDDALVS